MSALFISFHLRRGSSGGAIAARGFESVSRAVLGGALCSIFQDDVTGEYDADGVCVRVSRRSSIAMAWRLVVQGDLGRHRFRFDGRKLAGTSARRVAVVDGVGHASVLPALRKEFSPVLVIHQNFEPDYYADSHEGKWSKRLWVRAGRRAEALAACHADFHFFVTREDMGRFQLAFSDTVDSCAVLGVQEESVPFAMAERPDDPRIRVLITGGMGDRKGVVGLLDLLKMVSNERDELLGSFHFIVAGRNPPPAVKGLADGDLIELHEDVPDIGTIARTCDLYLNPNYTGSGIKVRNLDGLRNGLPVLCRIENSAGFRELPGDVFQTFRSTAEGIGLLKAMHLKDLTVEGPRRKAWQAYVDHFSVEVGARRFRDALAARGWR